MCDFEPQLYNVQEFTVYISVQYSAGTMYIIVQYTSVYSAQQLIAYNRLYLYYDERRDVR